MTYKVNGITLFGVNYRESDKMLTIFTVEKGKIGAVARGVRKANAKSKQISEPFCFAEAVISEKSGRKTITEINPFDNFYPVRTDVVKYYAGMCALELTNAFMPEGLVAEGHFVLLAEFLKKLAYSTINAVNLLVKFFYDAAEENGFASRRKTLVNNLMQSFKIPRSEAEEIVVAVKGDCLVRGETLSTEDFVELSRMLKQKGSQLKPQ